MRKVTVAATQFASGERNLEAADTLVRAAARAGANIILPQELFETNYFCQKPSEEYFALATTLEENPAVRHFQGVAKELGVVIPVSFFERKSNAYYNTLAMLDANGAVLGTYRKSHIPDGAGYGEKFYFNPGDTGFCVWDTEFGRIGAGVCWDQWFPEAARIMCLKGAELLLYPTAIGSEPLNPALNSRKHWQTCMQGHAAANLTPVIASNRTGTEREGDFEITFYGNSFIADGTGQLAAALDERETGFVTAEFDLDELHLQRRAWGVFRDRRPDLYGAILTLDGETYV
ncbi:MAG: N-carbamoylputrescine amidase [Oscillospiraceae bacterium]|jgi:N-carbamoylputrescine amidase|nr:N-carbamoylputrescine amidase [Oscillospiraceae bacterium]